MTSGLILAVGLTFAASGVIAEPLPISDAQVYEFKNKSIPGNGVRVFIPLQTPYWGLRMKVFMANDLQDDWFAPAFQLYERDESGKMIETGLGLSKTVDGIRTYPDGPQTYTWGKYGSETELMGIDALEANRKYELVITVVPRKRRLSAPALRDRIKHRNGPCFSGSFSVQVIHRTPQNYYLKATKAELCPPESRIRGTGIKVTIPVPPQCSPDVDMWARLDQKLEVDWQVRHMRLFQAGIDVTNEKVMKVRKHGYHLDSYQIERYMVSDLDQFNSYHIEFLLFRRQPDVNVEAVRDYIATNRGSFMVHVVIPD